MDAQPSQELRALIQKVSGGATLTENEIRTALDQMTAGAATPAQMGAFLMALRVRGETVEEITGAAQMLRSRMNRVEVPSDAVDIVGTGGDSHGTYNVSTCAALVAAGAGVKIAKHGNRRVSSRSGASDVLAELGVKLDVPFDTISRCVAEAGLGFLWAPQHHPAMKHWAAIRGELGIRTIFNLLGPISNPGGVKRQVVGVFSWHWVEPIAHVLKNLGAQHVWVVHGHDGLDELTTTGATDVAELKNGKIEVFEVTPADAVALHEVLGGGGDAVLIGHDWGAEAAYGAAAHAPDRWRRLVTLAVPPAALDPVLFSDYEQLKRFFYLFMFRDPAGLAETVVARDDLAFLDELWRDWSPGFQAGEHLAQVKQSLRQPANLAAALGYYRAEGAAGPAGQAPGTADRYAAEQQAVGRQAPQPTLYLHGARDGCIGVDLARGAERFLAPSSRMIVIDDAGHFLQLEKPSQVNDHILSWIT